jgi:hypothetical protein
LPPGHMAGTHRQKLGQPPYDSRTKHTAPLKNTSLFFCHFLVFLGGGGGGGLRVEKPRSTTTGRSGCLGSAPCSLPSAPSSASGAHNSHCLLFVYTANYVKAVRFFAPRVPLPQHAAEPRSFSTAVVFLSRAGWRCSLLPKPPASPRNQS